MRNYFILYQPGTALSDTPRAVFDSRDYGLYISGAGTLSIPGINWNPVSVPGRVGSILMKPQIENQPLTYPAGIAPVNGTCGNYPDYLTAVSAVRDSLMRFFLMFGYLELVDSYYPQIFRKVYFAELTEFDSQPDLKSGACDLVFSASPQRFLTRETTAGNYKITATYNSPVSLEIADYHNLIYGISAAGISPIISVSTSGTFHFTLRVGGLTVPGGSVTVSSGAPSWPVIIDSQLKECYTGMDLPANPYVSFSLFNFPEFHGLGETSAGAVSLVVDSGSMTAEIKPGWWAL